MAEETTSTKVLSCGARRRVIPNDETSPKECTRSTHAREELTILKLENPSSHVSFTGLRRALTRKSTKALTTGGNTGENAGATDQL
ncbi:hypothetical protein F2Q70_00038982 [Brassica cretica]|uniref:Uncharacterized protein n=1 Tax=Brassica cretica TaxID=69181 RepID=A0A8S9K417_BRACR|nr:hypothetical protein F2Q70_00038982 [Brassica cretica]